MERTFSVQFVPVLPWTTERLVGEALTVKSGVAAALIVSATTVVWVVPPPVAVTVTFTVPVVAVLLAVNVRAELPLPGAAIDAGLKPNISDAELRKHPLAICVETRLGVVWSDVDQRWVRARPLTATEAVTALSEDAGRAAYLGAFHATQAFIFEQTNKVAKTQGVHGQFLKLVRDEPPIDVELRRFLSEGYKLKAIADYETGPDAVVPLEQAAMAIETASRFIQTIAEMLG